MKKTGNTVLVDKYAQKTALRLGVTPEAVRKEFGKTATTTLVSADDEFADISMPEEQATITLPNGIEFGLLQILFKNDELVGWASNHLDPNWISNTGVRKLASDRFTKELNHDWLGISHYLNSLPDWGKNLLSGAIHDLVL